MSNELKTIKVLLVEDNPADARLVRELFLDIDASEFELTHVETLNASFDALQQHNFDVMLLDLSLPDSQGLNAVNSILQVTPQLPIVILSGIDDAELSLAAVQSG
ncbi:MAG: response regulator, partial [Thioalkalispiraceae bacterium]